jgi:transcriptional regulator with XRE-family HTH domain
MDDEKALGEFLKDRRMRIDPTSVGFVAGRRRTPGLRREEVAQRANISPTWYTWLEQGRGGAPSAHVLERIASALLMTEDEREHAFLLGLGRPPEARYHATEGIEPRLQRVLDALNPSAAFIRSVTWEVLAWNRAATVVLTDYSSLPADQRNLLRQMFLNPQARAVQVDWRDTAHHMVSVFRSEIMRAAQAAWRSSLLKCWRRKVRVCRHVHGREVGGSGEGRQVAQSSEIRPTAARILFLHGGEPVGSFVGGLQSGQSRRRGRIGALLEPSRLV